MRKYCYFIFLLLVAFVYLAWVSPTNNGKTLFSLLSSEQTQIKFNNKLQDTKDHNIMLYSNFYGGAGVGLGDLNNDGLTDIYFAGNQVGDQLYLNKGNLQFEDITQSAGIKDDGRWSSGVLIADVNQDGWQDIYVTCELYDDAPALRRNKLYINNHNNTFTESAQQYNVADTARTRHATFLDYDKDGDLDLFLLNQPPNPGDYSKYYNTPLLQKQYRPKLMENKGSRFEDVSAKAGFDKTGFPNSVTANDINGDGWTDLYIANDFWVGDWYYINNGDGTFTNKIEDYTRHISFSSMGVDAADMNNDGMLDIAVVDMAAEDNYRSKANMSGMNPEAFWKVVEDGDHYQYMFNMMHLNIGEGYLSDIAQMGGVATTDWSWSVLMADLDNDSWKDLFITNGLMRDIRNKDASKKFPKYLESELHKFIQNNPNPQNVGIWDIVDIDKALSLVPSEKLKNYVYQNNGDLTFSKKIEDWGFEQKTFSNGAAYADLDNDGDLDLVVNNINDLASVYENHSTDRDGKNYIRIKPLAAKNGGHTFGVKVWAVTEKGQQFFEITGVRGMYSTSESIAHFGLGDLTKVQKIKVQWPDGKEKVIENVQANQILKVAYDDANERPSNDTITSMPYLTKIGEKIGLSHRHVENKFDDYKTQVLLPHKMSTLGPCLAVGDVNGDGLEDFYIGGSVKKPASLYLQSKDATFVKSNEAIWQADQRPEDVGAVFFDADGDKDLDLYVVSGGNEFLSFTEAYQDRLYLNDGLGNFTKSIDRLPKITTSGGKVRPMDFDKDGDIDLFVAGRHIPWAYPEPASSMLLINDNGTFTDATETVAPKLKSIGLVNDTQWFDHNNDGWQDLILVGEWMPITILENQNGKLVALSKAKGQNSKLNTQNSSEGWWFSVKTADMDGDGDEDIIAGNLGLNYKYKASQEEPFEVYYDDFDGNKSKDVVLTYYNYGIQYPLRGRQCSSEQIPSLKDKMPTYDIFASSNVEQVYGEDNLENALHYEATTFASTYFENKGNGNFEAHVLPMLSQISSINDMIIQDFNQDGNKDILLAGNLYNAEVETTRNDAGFGLLLAGDGDGNFTEVDRKKSGFFVPYNVKQMLPLQSPLGRLVLVACNDDELQVYKVNSAVEK